MSYLINNKLYERTLLQLCPHGVNEKTFKPLSDDDPDVFNMRKHLFGREKVDQYKFILFYNNRNIQRKRPMNLLMGYRIFCENLSKEDANKCCLILHTEPKLDAGTDLIACREAIGGPYMENIYFTSRKYSPEEMNLIYNITDVTINIASSEGFGLSTAESLMAGSPIIVCVTGGLQDQIGQTDDDGKPLKFTLSFSTNSIGKYKNHGVWCKAIWPRTDCTQGSVPTPYIQDSLVDQQDVAEAIMYWYLMPREKRKACGLKGREWALNDGGINAKNMCQTFIDGMEFVFKYWVPPKSFDVFTINDYVGHKMPFDCMGFEIPKIDKEEIKEEIEKKTININ